MSEAPQFKFNRRLITIGLLVPCLLISVPALFAYRVQSQLFTSFHWVSHTIEVQRQLSRLLSLLADAETGARGFLLSSRPEYLAPYRSAVVQIPAEAAQIHTLTADNPVQQEQLRQLDPLLATKLDILSQTVALQERGGRQAALDLFGTHRGAETMDAIRQRLALMEQEESRLLIIRQDTLASQSRFGTGLATSLVVLSMVFALVILMLARRLARLQHLVTMCAWSRTVEYEGEWLSFEDYLQRRFNLSTSHGISPAEAEKAFGSARKP
jgi:CHASE3 domain sensor protein